jgi:hypothetical protein
MPDNVTPAPLKAADYQAAVLADLESGTPDPAVAAEIDVPAEKPGALETKAAREITQATPNADDAAPNGDGGETGAPKNAPPALDPKPEEKAKGFDALVREKAALRKRESEIKAREEQVGRMERIEKAAKDGDALGVLAALGLNYDRAVQQALGIQKKDAKTPEKKPEVTGLDEVRAEMKALREENERYRANQARADHVSRIGEFTKANEDKYPITSAKNAHAQALGYLEKYYAETGELPSNDAHENYRIALEALETDLAKEAKSWEAILTKTKKPANDTPAAGIQPPKPAGQSAASNRPAQSKTLTNSQVAHKAPPAEPKTAEDYQRAVLAELEAQTG